MIAHIQKTENIVLEQVNTENSILQSSFTKYNFLGA